jgi:uncharacterized integral membrane protein (TIGR00697 family)
MDSPVDRRQQLFFWLIGLFVAALLVGDLIGGKYFRVGSLDLSVGMLAFPLTFVLTDVLNEFFGPARTRLVTYVGLGAAIFSFILINVAIALPTSPETPLSGEVFATAFGNSRRLIVASLSAYLIGQLLDISLFTLLRRLTQHRMLWLRSTGSTLGSQLIDTLVVNFVFLSGTKSLGYILTVSRNSYVIKVVFALAMTPLIYAIHALVLRVVKVGEPPETVFQGSPPQKMG